MRAEWLLLMMSVLIASTYSADSGEDMDERIVGGRKATGKDRLPANKNCIVYILAQFILG